MAHHEFHDEEEPEKENSERWLLTYSDMITLLLALFIIMYSMSVLDAEKYKEVANAMSGALNNTEAGAGGGGGVSVDPSTTQNALDTITTQIQQYITNNNMNGTLTVAKNANSVIINIQADALFYPDSSTLLPDSIPIIEDVSQVLNSVYTGIGNIYISGNTADIGVDTIEAWNLSADRAVAVLVELVNDGLPQSKLIIEGRSHFNPVASNDSEANMAKNRRVDITITPDASNGGIISK